MFYIPLTLIPMDPVAKDANAMCWTWHLLSPAAVNFNEKPDEFIQPGK